MLVAHVGGELVAEGIAQVVTNDVESFLLDP